MTLADLRRIALQCVPVEARIERRLKDDYSWGPAHEIAHLLLASPEELTQKNFGLTCPVGYCGCPGERCDVCESAAMTISGRLLELCGNPELAEKEVEDTADYDRMVAHDAADSLLESIGLLEVLKSPDTAWSMLLSLPKLVFRE